MNEGFYCHQNNIYYGFYDENQVSGWMTISSAKPEYIRTDHPFHEEEKAVRFWDNHRLLEPEYADLQTMLQTMASFLNLNTESEVDFSTVEKKLNLALPKELKRIYTAIHDQAEYFAAPEHFLPLDEIYVEQGMIVFFKKKRTPIAGYDLESGCLARYYKKEWTVERGDMCCYQFCVGRILTIALENKSVFKKGRCKGRFVTALNIERELEKYCNEQYHLLPGFHVYGIAVVYSNEGLIAWIRSNGFYADIHAGADEEAQLDALGRHLGEMTWK